MDICTLLGTFGLFFTLFLLFVRFLPMVAMAEVKAVLPAGRPAPPTRPQDADAPRAGDRPCERGELTDDARAWSSAEFATAGGALPRLRAVRDAGYTRWDAHTPFPVHGIDNAMGLKRSSCPGSCSSWRMRGAGGGFALQSWVHSVDYPSVISGKPLFAWPAYIPVTFELARARRRARRGARHPRAQPAAAPPPPALRSTSFERASDDRFFISIESRDPRFDASATPELLRQAGASRLEWLTA